MNGLGIVRIWITNRRYIHQMFLGILYPSSLSLSWLFFLSFLNVPTKFPVERILLRVENNYRR